MGIVDLDVNDTLQVHKIEMYEYKIQVYLALIL